MIDTSCRYGLELLEIVHLLNCDYLYMKTYAIQETPQPLSQCSLQHIYSKLRICAWKVVILNFGVGSVKASSSSKTLRLNTYPKFLESTSSCSTHFSQPSPAIDNNLFSSLLIH